MTRPTVCLVSFLLVVTHAVAQHVTIKPEKPVHGKPVSVSYNSKMKGAILFNADTVEAQLLLYKSVDDSPTLLEAVMKKKGGTFEAAFPLNDRAFVYATLQFVSGKNVDDNTSRLWEFFLHDPKGKTLAGAHLMRSYALLHPWRSFKRERDAVAARKEAMEEDKLYPGRIATRWRLLDLDFFDTSKKEDGSFESLIHELTSLSKLELTDHQKLAVFSWYTRLKKKELADDYARKVIEAEPDGYFAQRIGFSKLFEIKSKEERAERALEFIREHPTIDDGTRSPVVSMLMSAGRYEEAEELALSMTNPGGSLLNTLAWDRIEQDRGIERGVELAERGIASFRTSDISTKEPYLSRREWETSRRYGLGMILDTYAFGLEKIGRHEDAEPHYLEAVDLLEADDPEVNERAVQCLVRNGKQEKALEVARRCIEKGKSTDALIQSAKQAHVSLHGSDDGFDAFVDNAKNAAKRRMKEELLSNVVNQPAKDFEARSLKGEMVHLSALRGKVVVLDFWATWCGPCKAAFPYLQKVFDKYRMNPDVQILAVNTWERVAGKEREDAVTSFIEENKYTFPVVFDESKIVENYGVDGIPTQFYIDRNGTIQFKEIGFSGPEMEMRMSVMIDMLLTGEDLSTN